MKDLTVRHVWEAKERIQSTVSSTPLLYSLPLSKRLDVPVFLKLEQLHPTGSFKLRGATNMINNLSEEEKATGVTTFSTGNHGFAVAFAASRLGLRAVICISENVPSSKVEALKESGAELHIEGKGQDDAEAACYRLRDEEGLTVIPPFDHPDIIAGQGTIGLEILEELPQVTTVMGGLSGGGLLSGVGMVMKEAAPDTQVIGLCVEKGAAMDESLLAGKPVVIPEHPTYADSLLGGIGQKNKYTYRCVKQYVDQRCRLPEEIIAKGMAYLYEKHRLVVEGAAAVGVGALLAGTVQPTGPTVILVTGNNVGVKDHYKAVHPYIAVPGT
ncbi:hydroxyectoine utilization dehydratase EutB [Thalassobacillus sp. C254]|uniref:hydroxyectoine utilization dehydratase EutB n=1 Tax=Thalassobacillus sp. C254 TaxID=1225341 RepID=UPI0006D23FC8|nr:hydroxyectoine utilization dehydratase EutB [Thalassobacillus sp. C254]